MTSRQPGGAPRDSRILGHDGITAMVNEDRALRAREVSAPPAVAAGDATSASDPVEELIARTEGRRR